MQQYPILSALKNLLTTRQEEVEAWCDAKIPATPHLITHSVDIRFSGHKLVPIDTNLYPAGFNNLTPASRQRALTQAKTLFPEGSRILILPEEHTRNLKYLDSLSALHDLLEDAGFTVQIGSLSALEGPEQQLTSASGDLLTQYAITTTNGRLQTVQGFVPDAVVLNNDFTQPPPDWLMHIAQPIMPPPDMGWYRRRKSVHFEAYNQLMQDFGRSFDLDVWPYQSRFAVCDNIDFMEQSGLECVARNVEKLIHSLRESYHEHGIAEDPYVFIKSDHGTYGMGIMTARSGEDVLTMNRKLRKKMQAIKGGTLNSVVVIQEGITSIDRIEGQTAEAMLYLLGSKPIGGAYRTHPEKGEHESLNSVGMQFYPLCCKASGQDNSHLPPHCDFSVLGLIARLAALAVYGEEYEDAPALRQAAG